MPQLHLYVPEDVAEATRARARSRGQSLSGFLADLVRSQIAGEWPKDFFTTVAGGWKGRALRRPVQGHPERRERL